MGNEESMTINPELRKKAESKLDWSKIDEVKDEDLRKLVCELSIHQIELELQNEELMHIQNQLEQKNFELKFLYDFAPVGYCTLDGKGDVVKSNLTLANMLSENRSNLVTCSLFDFVDDEYKDALFLHLRSAFSLYDDSKKVCLLKIHDKQGVEKIVQLESTTLSSKKQTHTAVIDVTGREKAEERIRVDHEKLINILEGMEEVVYVADTASYEMLYLNGIAKRFWGNGVGKKCYEVLQNRTSPCPFCSNEKITSNLGESYIWEFKNEVNGHWYRCIDRLIPWVDNRMVRFELAVDITDRKKAEEVIAKKNKELKKLDLLKTNFINITSHEIRTPMTAIKGHIEMMANGLFGEVTLEQKKSLEVVLRNTNRLDALIDDVLDTSRLESGTMKFVTEKISVETMVNEAVETMQKQADTQQIEIRKLVGEGIDDLVVDRLRIAQVFVNLLSNAIKFSDRNGVVEFSAINQDDGVLFEVRDYGRGIPEDQLEKVFDLFHQVDCGMDRSVGGTGLGLTISQGIVMGHGGRIWVENNVGCGCVFKVVLPKTPVLDVEGSFKKIDVFNLRESVEQNTDDTVDSIGSCDS